MRYPALAPAPISIGRFRVEGTLGLGTSHVLYQAIDNRTGTQVALKCGLPGMDHPGLEPSLKGEWEAAQRLAQPGIQRVLEMAREDGVGTYLVLESLEGSSLASLIVHGVPIFQGLHLLVQLLHVLERAESDGLLHGDLRPENLWISPTGTLMVLGFGSTTWSGSGTGPALSNTSAHMAPERVGGAPPSPGSELYAFAVTAFQVLTGHLPYGSSSAGELDPAGPRSPHFPLDMPRAMQRVFSKALDPQPENRYSSLHGFISVLIAASPLGEDRLEALLAFVDGAPVPADLAGLLPAEAAVPEKAFQPRDTQPIPIQVPAKDHEPESNEITSPVSHGADRARIEGFLSGLSGVQEFAIYSLADTLEAGSRRCEALASLAPSSYFQMADSVHPPESKDSVRTITIKSQRRGSILLLRHEPFSIALLLKPGKNPKGILDDLRALRPA